MAELKLPNRFQKTLESNQALYSIVLKTCSEFGEILTENKLFFFPEYTDHGINHVENVLNSSNNLIPKNTFNILTTEDIGYYILSTILHDIGMHITFDGFVFLLNGGFDNVINKELDNFTWKELWEEYLSEAKRFSGKQLKSIFGNENYVVSLPNFTDIGSINENDKKLIGEFIRRNHFRLAYEISLKGFPGKNNFLEFAVGLDFQMKNLIGIIARSHGLSLRLAINQLELVYGENIKRFPFNTHAAYLMVLLRISDFIQIDSSRISKTLIKLKTFSSPISELEHNSHFSIDSVDDKHQEDPERIFVQASPRNSVLHLKLLKLIKEIQNEFDVSWAVLGEFFGRGGEKLEIKYRRIISNLEDSKYINKRNFVADSFSLKVNDDIVKLLIAPLYGSDPKYGVRELLQNAVDACKEREIIENNNSKKYKGNIKVQIIFEDNKYFFIITDNGIGMNTEIIKNYFLRAGASYRKSQEWEKDFLNEDGQSKVRRSGRFGIGILAGFLIGSEIEVETKRLDEDFGYQFSFNLGTEQIDVRKNDKIQTGTQIRIKIKSQLLTYFEPNDDQRSAFRGQDIQWFEWFNLSDPIVKYFYFGKRLESKYPKSPGINDNLPFDWNSIEFEKYNKILWTYNENFTNHNLCNGFGIQQTYGVGPESEIISFPPHISIFDYSGIAPLALNRNSFSGPLPFRDELLLEIYKDFIAYILTYKTKSSIEGTQIKLRLERLKYIGCRSFLQSYFHITPLTYKIKKEIFYKIFFGKQGFIINYPYFINLIKKLPLIILQAKKTSIIDCELDIHDKFLDMSNRKLNSFENIQQTIYGEDNSAHIIHHNYKFESFTYLNKDDVNKDLFKSAVSPFYKKEFNEIVGWYFVNVNNYESIIPQKFLEENRNKINLIREYSVVCGYEGDKSFDSLLQKYFGNEYIIPYKLHERKKKFPKAFEELSRFMQKYLGEWQ